MAQDQFAAPVTVALTRAQVAEILIRFCLENKIPLSRSATKSVVVLPGPGGAGLHICLRTILSAGLSDDDDG